MVAEPRTWVPVTKVVREWARDSVLSIDRRVFRGVSRAPFPQIIPMRISGPDDDCLIQFDVWGAPGGADQAEQVAADLATAADALGRYTSDGVILHGARVEDVRWQPDDESDQPRFIVQITFFATSDGLSDDAS
jgi:hypothetical protein